MLPWHSHRREIADSWARTNRPKKMKKTDMSVSKLKLKQVARSENEAQFAAADRNRVESIE